MEIIDLEPWAPTTGFLRRYLEWTANHEGPLRFQFWTALTILSAAIGRRFFISKGFYQVFPNLYVMLIAPSGRSRKSTTTGIGSKLLSCTDVRVLSNKITPEDLISRMENVEVDMHHIRRNAEAFLYAAELTVFLGKQGYNDGMVDLLTDFADAPDKWSYSTKKGGKIELMNVCLVLLACSTADWLGEAIPQRAFGGGFLARIIFVVQNDTPRYFAIPEEQDPKIKDELERFLLRVRHSQGEFKFSAHGLHWYKLWYGQNRNGSISEDLRLNGYFERRPDHLLRVAMLLAVSEDLPLVLTSDLLERALAILLAVEPRMSEALREINITASGKEANRIMTLISGGEGRIRYEDIMRASLPFSTQKITDETLRGLISAGKLVEYISPQGRSYELRRPDQPYQPSVYSGVEEHEPEEDT